ncbi:MAG: hypothetical protein GTO42_02175 [Candidatus Latescibacteria bacterium]|nr:hypothetical protein [Candidatus Latescibacterota bacterium]NIO00942.1 hypothetical protein [Candidatus Latescibacterota bacterium]NIO27341.1 hypothetical protein [Candidatus Latescibacterota bacterium]NIO54863.1 hypothetical protein [Candidatus Latescibacterota bacterium]NIT00952.1 hypothetical protein [Candidatus Latescibacterota bacterium]
MAVPHRFLKGMGFAVLVLLLASPLLAQVEDQISAYTGRNASGYLQPLADAFGADLNDGLFHSAYIPRMKFNISVEFRVMGVLFGDDDRTFMATTESGFAPEQTVAAPTVVGSGNAVFVDGAGGTRFAFPGGFNLNSFALAVPQIRVGSYMGTEALIRYIAFDTGDVELGDISLVGFGLRHSLSQYLAPTFPLYIAAGFFWQRFTLGENQRGGNLISTNAFSFGAQASRRFQVFEPYGGVSFDTFSMDVEYESDALGTTQSIDLEFETDTTLHLTLGLGFNFTYARAFAEYSVAGQNSFSFGLAFGN